MEYTFGMEYTYKKYFIMKKRTGKKRRRVVLRGGRFKLSGPKKKKRKLNKQPKKIKNQKSTKNSSSVIQHPPPLQIHQRPIKKRRRKIQYKEDDFNITIPKPPPSDVILSPRKTKGLFKSHILRKKRRKWKNRAYLDIHKTKKKMDLILLDPPWRTQTSKSGDTKHRGQALTHYPTMSLREMKKLPVPKIAGKNCVLLMWIISTKLFEAMKLIEHWGFKYINEFKLWTKDELGLGTYTRTGNETILWAGQGSAYTDCWIIPETVIYDNKFIINSSRKCILCRKGSILPFRAPRSVYRTNVLYTPHHPAEGMEDTPELMQQKFNIGNSRRVEYIDGKPYKLRHSQKPRQFYDHIEEMFPKAKNKIEMFARNSRFGWYCWGNDEAVTQ